MPSRSLTTTTTSQQKTSPNYCGTALYFGKKSSCASGLKSAFFVSDNHLFQLNGPQGITKSKIRNITGTGSQCQTKDSGLLGGNFRETENLSLLFF